ncbi:MAG: hypothetical protein LUG84_01180 [Akkermansiaceae bacterium]|nr:hypothetical protein [Akkermansiaceae bacterium]
MTIVTLTLDNMPGRDVAYKMLVSGKSLPAWYEEVLQKRRLSLSEDTKRELEAILSELMHTAGEVRFTAIPQRNPFNIKTVTPGLLLSFLFVLYLFIIRS